MGCNYYRALQRSNGIFGLAMTQYFPLPVLGRGGESKNYKLDVNMPVVYVLWT
jgi:hypothetical protein